MAAITRDGLLTLEAYARIRVATRAQAIAHRRRRSVALGDRLWLQFEDERTVRRQIQDVLHAGKVFDERGIQAEIDAYAALLPDGSDWRASLLLALPAGGAQGRRLLERLHGVASRVWVEVAGAADRVHAVVDPDLGEGARALAVVHFLRFPLTAAHRAAALAGAAVTVGCDHPEIAAVTLLTAEAAASLAADLE